MEKSTHVGSLKKRIFSQDMPHSGPGSSLAAFVCVLILLYSVGVGVRMCFAPAWGGPEMRVMRAAAVSGMDEPLLSTPDAYYWLAGACGRGTAAALAPSRLLRTFSAATGMRPARAALLLPVFLASLLGPLLALLCRTLGFPRSGLCAGLLATLSPAYLCRTGLGYYDTDMLLLPVVLLTVLVLLFLTDERRKTGFVAAVVLGGGLACLQSWHRLLPVCNASLVLLAVVLLLVVPVRTNTRFKTGALYRVLFFASGLFFSWLGLVLAGLGSLVLLLAPASVRRVAYGKACAVSVLCVFLLGLALFSNLRTEAQAYLQRAQTKTLSHTQTLTETRAQAGSVRAPVYPPMTRTIAEAERISYAHLLVLLHPWAGVALAGLCGFAWLAWLRPRALLLAPLLAFGLSAPFLGARVAMFAVPAMALGFGAGAESLLRRIPAFGGGSHASYAVRALLAVVLSVPLALRLPPPETALSAPHAAALRTLGASVPHGPHGNGQVPMVWTWWDFGYAASWFSGLRSFADAGRQGPEYVYFLSKVLGGESLGGARRLMAFSAAQSFRPWEALNQLGADKAQELVAALLADGAPTPGSVRQFVVLSLDGLRLVPLIEDFARWDLRSGASSGESLFFEELPPPVELDLAHGRVTAPRSGIRTEVGAILRWDKGPEEVIYDTAKPLCLVALSAPEKYVLLDRRLYASNYLRLLLGDPEEARADFRLLVDDAPRVRIYELVEEKNASGG